MNILLKQRLVGAIVLISLAVIFLPMLFTSRGEQQQKFESSIPSEPVYEITSPQVSMPLPLPPKTLQKVPLLEPVAQEEQVQPAQLIQMRPPETAIADQKGDSSREPVAKLQTSPVRPAPSNMPGNAHTNTHTNTQTNAPTPTPDARMQPGEVTGWVVQVGSFNKQANAEQLRDKLRNMGMVSFVVTAVSEKQTVYRVRVGPEINREDAEKIQAKIQQSTKLNGLVMKYP